MKLLLFILLLFIIILSYSYSLILPDSYYNNTCEIINLSDDEFNKFVEQINFYNKRNLFSDLVNMVNLFHKKYKSLTINKLNNQIYTYLGKFINSIFTI